MYNSKRIRIMPKNKYATQTWKTDNTSVGSSNNNQIKLPLIATGTYNCIVEWGDGSSDYITTWNQAETTHTYTVIGTYEVNIKGQCFGWQFNNAGDKLKLLTINRWGEDFRVGNVNSHFYGCTNLQIDTSDSLNTSDITDMYSMFYDCSSLNGDIKFTDTSNVTNMAYMFRGCTVFNGNITSLNTSNVTTMAGMFYSCVAFNKPVNNFNTSKVESMYALFYNCTVFNQSVSNFDTAKVTNMSYMFSDCNNFNQDVSGLNTGLVTDMRSMFYGSGAYNPNISGWNVENVTDLSYILFQKYNFNRDLSGWDISKVTTMEEMLTGCTSWSTANYDAALIAWDALSVQSGVQFKCESYYTSGGAAEAARTSLVTGDSWTINDLGGV